jgi:hypothetical protein
MNLQCYIVENTVNGVTSLYFCSDRPIINGDYYINTSLQPTIRIQRAYRPIVKERCKRIEATSNTAYSVPQIPSSFVTKYFELDKKDRPVKTHFRILETNLKTI